MKNELLMRLVGKLSDEDIKIVMQEFDVVAYNYDITEKQTALVVYNDESYRLLEKFIAVSRIAGKSDKSLTQYYRSTKNFLDAVGKELIEISDDDIRVYLYKYQKERGVSNTALENLRKYIKPFFTWLVKEDYLVSNPFDRIDKVKHTTKSKKVLTADELESLRSACSNTRELAMINFLYSTGCRIGGLVGIRLEDVDFVNKEVMLHEKGDKYRTSFLSEECVASLKNYITEYGEKEFLFFSISGNSYGNQLSVGGAEYTFKEIVKRTGLKNVTPHCLRGTVATVMLDSGVPINEIQKFLGHSSVATTESAYAKTNVTNLKNHHSLVVS